MMGYSSGFVLKKVSKLLAFGIGSLFIVIQTLSYNGFIKVDYDNIQKEVEVSGWGNQSALLLIYYFFPIETLRC